MRRFLYRLLSFFRSTRAETDLAREITAHLRLLEDDFMARGMSAGAAGDAARRAFGGQVEQVKERQRDARSFRWLAESWLDLKLGARMLIKYPGLTAIAVFALAVAIGGGAAYLEFVNDLFRPALPGKDGDRIVGIVNWDAATGKPERRALQDVAVWRDTVSSVTDLGAYASFQRNLITDDGRTEPVRGVEISAAAFRVMPVAPLLGRPLVPDDERAGAPDVVLLGYPLWQTRFAGDPAVVGRSIRLGSATHTVVGVMPDGFGFPINHSLWVPLRAPAGMQRNEGPEIAVFARLAPGAGLEAAQAELTAIALRGEADAPGSNRRLRPQIKAYVDSLWSSVPNGQVQRAVLYSVNLFFLGLLAVCGANVATLVFARTATREVEITVRTALGASRGRIVAQLFAEALVLASLAAIIGLAAASFGTRWGKANWAAGAGEGAPAPFWWNDQLSLETLLYSGALALIAAAIVGVVPALKATGGEMQSRLKHAAGAASLKFGGVWTAVIVAQIALTVVFLLSGVSLGWNFYATGDTLNDVTFRRDEYLSARLEMDREPLTGAPAEQAQAAFSARFRSTCDELERRLLTEQPGVVGVMYATAFPGMKYGEFFVEFQGIETPVPADGGPLWVRTAAVGANFFATFDAPIVAGRSFTQADVDFDRPVAIVDQTFVRHVLSGRSPIGQWVRQPQNAENARPGPWYEVVGVVADLSTIKEKTSEHAVLYRPARPGVSTPLHLAVHVRGNARALAPRVRTIAATVDPTLRLYEVMSLDQVDEAERLTFGFFLRVLGIVSAVALILSAAGVYALLAFTVARRTREIGIRAAVGADRWQILTGIFSRAFAQVGLGVAAGSVPGILLVTLGAPEVSQASGPTVAVVAFAAVAAFMLCVALLACVVPARRALRIQPTDALRADA